jgi:endonuclease/exonuclease/phosphatase family metal-dependent hydrolase
VIVVSCRKRKAKFIAKKEQVGLQKHNAMILIGDINEVILHIKFSYKEKSFFLFKLEKENARNTCEL